MSKYNYSSNNSSSGIGVLGVLQIIFIVLKCLDLVTWTWAQVFIPAFIGIGITVVVIIALLIYFSKPKNKDLW